MNKKILAIGVAMIIIMAMVAGVAFAADKIQPGSFYQEGTNAKLVFRGTGTSGEVELYDGSKRIAYGKYSVNGERVVVNFTGQGTDYFYIISPTELRGQESWFRM